MTTPTATTTQTVGRFTISSTGVVEGPAAYMAERGTARLRRIEAGTDVVFNYGLSTGRDPLTLALVSLQTDYAAWLGEQEMARRSAAARASQEAFLASRRTR